LGAGIEVSERPIPRTLLPRLNATTLTAMTLLWAAVLSWGVTATGPGATATGAYSGSSSSSSARQEVGSSYEGKTVSAIELPRVPERDREHLLELLPQKVGSPLDRDQVRTSIRALYGTGRFADIQAEVTPSASGVVLAFVTS